MPEPPGPSPEPEPSPESPAPQPSPARRPAVYLPEPVYDGYDPVTTGRNTVVIFILGLSGARLLLAARRRRR
ncbi:hypothetical protein ACFQY4_42290 [Catellatospora bangladeshensis]|uniref:hypothetical protein n=1 Tax=Catellatospora bangladeshensis TaxID=310355 RepID=UPI00361284D8